jgi:hypothetical protein
MKGGKTDAPEQAVDVEDVRRQLDELERMVSSSEERREVGQTRKMLRRLSGSNRI